MTAKSDFNAEEWTTLAEAPLFAALRVADPYRAFVVVARRLHADALSPPLLSGVSGDHFVDCVQLWVVGLGVRHIGRNSCTTSVGAGDDGAFGRRFLHGGVTVKRRHPPSSWCLFSG